MPIVTNTKESWRPVLEQVKSITGFTIEDEQLIQNAAKDLLPHSQEIAADFYEILLAYEPVAAIFEKLDADGDFCNKKLVRWIESLLKGQYDDRFWTWHWVVGLVHVQYNLDHAYIMTLFAQLQKILLKRAFRTFRETSAKDVTLALLNLTNCLSALAFKAYLLEYREAIEASGMKESVLNRMISMEVKNKLKKISTVSSVIPDPKKYQNQ